MGNSLKPYEFPDEASEAFELDASEPRDAAVGPSRGSWHARLRDPRRLLVAACLVVACAAAGTFAWLSTTGVLANQFGIGVVQPSVSETLGGAVKSDVKLTNDGSTPAYMRAQVDIYWQDDGGARVWDELVADTDYKIDWSSDAGWSQGPDGFWYWNTAVGVFGFRCRRQAFGRGHIEPGHSGEPCRCGAAGVGMHGAKRRIACTSQRWGRRIAWAVC